MRTTALEAQSGMQLRATIGISPENEFKTMVGEKMMVNTLSKLVGLRIFVLLIVVGAAIINLEGVALANHRSNGSGTCWQSGAAWPNHSTQYYNLDSSIPSDWRAPIGASASTWNNVSTSSFVFYWSQYPPANGNYMNRANLGAGVGGATTTTYSSGNSLTKATTTFNTYWAWSVNGSPNALDVQNVATHELGHWLRLADISTAGCGTVTMWSSTVYGETIKRTLHQHDKNGVAWQYP
ncbi:MAG: hypothetical protein ACRDHL_03610 [Candidatus Promineifilaceae bacterium]